MQRWATTLEAVAKEKGAPLFSSGDIAGYVNSLRAVTDPGDWMSLQIAGNLLFGVAPDAALTMHEAARALAPRQGTVHLELAHDYQRAGRCEPAIAAWQEADKHGALASPVTAVAAYCCSEDPASRTRGAALLSEALRDFPFTASLHRLRFERVPPAPQDRERALLDWILAEYAGLSRGTDGAADGIPTATTLRSLVFTLQKMRSAPPAAR